jgi:hypothetical protein
MHQVIDDCADISMVSFGAGISTTMTEGETFMNPRYAIGGLLAALIAIPMYYMFYSMFTNGFETNVFLVALTIGVVTFIVTWFIASLVARSKQRAA